ncbi:low temperature requirement protein A [Sediminimonas qiaohouensis]|uniref:low temperature requirement protein A n=1 Tax=Sediminimonas qiaohouensis TaxID=552061 RepID=UPI0003FE4024|nr:low temperature requirement protein A [Sediminimonas qiaohouensis]
MPLPISFRFSPRARDETHRVATPLELLFDLASVIAIAAAAHGLVHAVAENHLIEGLVGFLVSFFMIWLAWMNYTWFASAYDDRSPAFRVLSMVIMFGAIVLAAGIGAVFAHERIWLALLGFVIMRLGMVVFWLGAARGDPARRSTAHRYAGGIAAMQVYWVLLVVIVPPAATIYLPFFVLGAAAELVVPGWAERAGATTWHRHHIIERYGLLNIIVLGECFIAITAMIQLQGGGGLPEPDLFALAALSAIIAFSLWGLYFTDEDHLPSDELGHALLWGYGHFALYAAGAAAGAGMTVILEIATDHAHVAPRTGALAVAVPVAIYLATLWLIRDRFCLHGWHKGVLPVAAALVVAFAVWLPAPMLAIAVLLPVVTLLRRGMARGREAGETAP